LTRCGEHTLAATRQGYRAAEQKVAVIAGQTIPVSVALERISATFTVRTVPDGVAVLLDGIPKGMTPKGPERSDVSGPLIIPDLATGAYVTRYQRDCYKPLERSLSIAQLGDFEIAEPIRLEPAVAKLTLRISEPGATIYVDRVSKGANPAEEGFRVGQQGFPRERQEVVPGGECLRPLGHAVAAGDESGFGQGRERLGVGRRDAAAADQGETQGRERHRFPLRLL